MSQYLKVTRQVTTETGARAVLEMKIRKIKKAIKNITSEIRDEYFEKISETQRNRVFFNRIMKAQKEF